MIPQANIHNALYQKGDVVFADDKRAAGPDGAECWNLFEEFTDDARLIEDASSLFGLLFEERIRGAARPFYPTAARDLIMALAVYLKRRGDSDLCTCQALRELIDGFDMDSMCQLLEAAPEFRAFASYLGDGERAQGVVAQLQQAARELLAGRFGARGNAGDAQAAACPRRPHRLCLLRSRARSSDASGLYRTYGPVPD